MNKVGTNIFFEVARFYGPLSYITEVLREKNSKLNKKCVSIENSTTILLYPPLYLHIIYDVYYIYAVNTSAS